MNSIDSTVQKVPYLYGSARYMLRVAVKLFLGAQVGHALRQELLGGVLWQAEIIHGQHHVCMRGLDPPQDGEHELLVGLQYPHRESVHEPGCSHAKLLDPKLDHGQGFEARDARLALEGARLAALVRYHAVVQAQRRGAIAFGVVQNDEHLGVRSCALLVPRHDGDENLVQGFRGAVLEGCSSSAFNERTLHRGGSRKDTEDL